MKLDIKLLALTLLLTPPTWAQTTPAAPKSTAEAGPAKPAPDTSPRTAFRCSDASNLTERTFYLNNAVQQSDSNELVTALRNMLDPCDRIFLVWNQAAIMMQAPPDQMTLAEKLIKDLDRPKKTYRLTYTVTDMDGDKRVGTQHFSMVVAAGQETRLKQGSRIPIATGSYDSGASAKPGPPGVQTQFTYLDIGMNFSATLDEFANGVRLRSNVDQSSAPEDKSIAGVQEPIIRQTELTGAAFLTPGKPLVLGSIDIPGSTRHLDIEVVMEQLP